MIPFNHTEFIDILKSHVNNNVIPMSRIDDAVRRILRVKFTMGLFENPWADETFIDQLGSQVSSLKHSQLNFFWWDLILFAIGRIKIKGFWNLQMYMYFVKFFIKQTGT